MKNFSQKLNRFLEKGHNKLIAKIICAVIIGVLSVFALYYAYLLIGAKTNEILEGDVVSLMRWAYSKIGWVEEQAKAYDSYASACERTLRSSGGLNNYASRIRLIERIVFERLRGTLLELLCGLDKANALETEGYAKHIACAVYDTVLACCAERNGKLSESTALVYNGAIRRFFDHIRDTLGIESAEKYAKWLNSQEIFMHYTVYNKFCEFKFEETE